MKQTTHDQQVLLSSACNGNVLPDHTDNGQNFTNSKTKFMKKTAFLTLLVMMIFGFLLTGCQQDDNEVQIESEQTTGQYDKRVYELSNDPEVQAELQFMKDELGYDLSTISIIKSGEWKGDYIHKGEWDAVVEPRENISDMLQESKNNDGNLQSKHRRNRYMATAGSKNIRYNTVSGVSVPSNWKTAINSARQKWNNLGKSLTFNTPTNGSYSSSNTVNVIYKPLIGYIDPEDYFKTIAIARIPKNGESIGTELIINSDMDILLNLSSNQKIFVMTHELGHNIGFDHTNTSGGYAQVITGNPICDNASDTNSLLRPGSNPVPSWPVSGTAFTFCDQLAFDVYY